MTVWLRAAARLICVLAGVSAGNAWSQDWDSIRSSEPFLVHAEFPIRRTDQLLAELKRLQYDVATVLGIPAPAERVELYLFRDERGLRRYLVARYPYVPARRAVFVKHGGPGMVFAYQHDELDVDLRHETTHALLHAALPNIPLWLDEGLAEYFETPAARRPDGHPYLDEVVWRRGDAKPAELLALDDLERLDELERQGDRVAMGHEEYRSAWAWVHFFLHGPKAARDVFADYLGELAAGRETTPLSRRLARIETDPAAAIAEHFRRE